MAIHGMFGCPSKIPIPIPLVLLAVASLTALTGLAEEPAAQPSAFTLEAVTDFIDDVSKAKEPITAEQIKSMMTTPAPVWR